MYHLSIQPAYKVFSCCHVALGSRRYQRRKIKSSIKFLSTMLKFRGLRLFPYWSVNYYHCHFFSNCKENSYLFKWSSSAQVRIQFYSMNMIVTWRKGEKLFMLSIKMVWFFLILLLFSIVHILFCSEYSKTQTTRRELGFLFEI